METITALVVELLGTFRASVGSAPCPGGWAWAVSAVGVGVGALSTAAAVLIALVRRGIGARSEGLVALTFAVLGLLCAGLLPYAVFHATGGVFEVAAAGGSPGFTPQQLSDLGESVCLVGRQASYLGRGTVAEAFGLKQPLALAVALVVLVPAPVLAALGIGVQARLALRRGPKWPTKYFWIPVLVLPFVTTSVPVGTAAHLWVGVVTAALLGIPVVLLMGAPSRETIRRSLQPRPSAAPPIPRRHTVRASGLAEPRHRTVVGPPTNSQPSLAERLAARFAARAPEPLIVLPEAHDQPVPAATTLQRHNPPTRIGPPPTLVAPPPVETPRFRLIRSLGGGGFGKVWLAHDARLGHTVALKAAHAPDPETEERIRREASALASVRHPNCVRIYDLVHARLDPGLGELDGLVIVMEYVDGVSLGELVRTRGTLDDIAAARVWAAVAGALDAAHGKGVLHRDVKPGNVVVDAHGIAHLIDFGIARRAGDSTLTATGFVLGTPDFLAPEVAAGERATPASDAWQLAATISFALTGYPPRGEHEDAVSGLRAAASGAPLTHLPQRTAHLTLLRAALDSDPTRRPTLADVEQALSHWLRSNGVGLGPITATQRL